VEQDTQRLIAGDPESTSIRDHYAHTAPEPGAAWQPLRQHLENVAELAAGFASAFDAADWARVAGMWHDVGKYSHAFQEYLRAAGGSDVHATDALERTDHSTAGAQHAFERFGPLGQLLAYVIAGHHAGLPDWDGPGLSTLRERLRKSIEDWDEAPTEMRELEQPSLPPILLRHFSSATESPVARRASAFGIALFTRMIFSALVDADFMDTEGFMDPDRSDGRPVWPDDHLESMLDALEGRIASFGPPVGKVNALRAEVADACRRAAAREPGLFTLTVPTGGGKTLASLLFALKHATSHGLRRVVYVAPFTSIIEQNASEFRKVMQPLVGAEFPDPVIEHHSNLDPERESDASRRATENYAAPLVVTTAVQFYESLFANRTSRCRKLHNLARSVIILDEAQSLPVDLLAPCLRALEALAGDYGASIVLCTATQPAVGRSESFPIGLALDADAEIVHDVPALFAALKRVKIEQAGHLPDEEVAERMRAHDQVLCIVNTRRHARALAELLGSDDGDFHLSALMCPAHRSEVLERIRNRLEAGEVCRVVSTQLIEAGVDVDFPIVYRALAGVDSIAQAAGRCNRHGRRPSGTTTVFETDHTSSERFIARQIGSARQILDLYDDLLSPEAINHYFRVHYWERNQEWDRQDVLDCFTLDRSGTTPFVFAFRTAASAFRLIDSTGVPIIIPWSNEGEALVEEMRTAWSGPSRTLLRKLQRYTIQIPERVWISEQRSAFEVLHEQYPVLALPRARYSPRFGLDLEGDIGTELVT
jgi:CRISPR-associated endonuclease/helicase Cas3